MRSLVCTVEPATEPIAYADAALYLKVDSDDGQADLERLISVARRMVEDFTGRALLTSTWKLTTDAWPGYKTPDYWSGPSLGAWAGRVIQLDRSPLATVESVKYYPASGASQATLSSGTYHVLTGPTPGLVVLKSDQSWPDLYDQPDAVEITFTAGVATAAELSPALLQAVYLVLAHLYENRTPVNIGNIVNEIPMSAKHLLESYRVGGWIA